MHSVVAMDHLLKAEGKRKEKYLGINIVISPPLSFKGKDSV